MPLSLRLPNLLESELAQYSARAGISKSAAIVRSIEEFMARHAQPNAHELYLQTLPTGEAPSGLAAKPADPRPRKQAFRDAMQAKQAARLERSRKPLAKRAREA
jgi:hypothetical protein